MRSQKILVVAEFIPMPDRQAGMLRFFHILRILAVRHRILFCACKATYQAEHYGEGEVALYRENLARLGIEVARGTEGEVNTILRDQKFDVILFEHYLWATGYIDEARIEQRGARIVIDTVDVAFQRLLSKARSSQRKEDFLDAQKTKTIELSVYRKADVVIAISDADKKIILQEDKHLDVDVVPLIHPVLEFDESRTAISRTLLFIGNFEHTANVDAIMYFCRDVLPIIRRTVPDARLTIVGNAPPRAVQSLAGNGVDVVGYVADIKPCYAASSISIAPLTWGGGLKGKISEALALGLPVVSTSVGIEGFGLVPEQDVLVGDTAEKFAEAVVRLFGDSALYETIRKGGWQFVKRLHSEESATRHLEELFRRLEHRPAKRPSAPVLAKTLAKKGNLLLDRHVLWRFKKR